MPERREVEVVTAVLNCGDRFDRCRSKKLKLRDKARVLAIWEAAPFPWLGGWTLLLRLLGHGLLAARLRGLFTCYSVVRICSLPYGCIKKRQGGG